MSEYEIRNEKGGLFCKCSHDDNGMITLKIKNCEIPLQTLNEQAYNPETAKKTRNKRRFKKK